MSVPSNEDEAKFRAAAGVKINSISSDSMARSITIIIDDIASKAEKMIKN